MNFLKKSAFLDDEKAPAGAARVNQSLYLKKISLKEKSKVSDKALKLIVKISEGSVRDALSLLDRGILSTLENEELSIDKIFKLVRLFDLNNFIKSSVISSPASA